MKIACIQTQASSLEQYKQVQQRLDDLITEAGQQGAQLIVLPECVYPAYYIPAQDDLFRQALKETDTVLSMVSNKARQFKTYIAFGLIEEEEDIYYNAAFLFNPQGKVVAKSRKTFLWHFDKNIFHPGDRFDVVDTEFGKWAMLICADARMPELPRMLALQGVDLVIDLANLTTTGKDPAAYQNAQCGYMLRARSLENGIWWVMADKVGVEAQTVAYCGRSCLISPDGQLVVEASSHKEEIVYADVHDLRQRECFGGNIDLLKDRRPQSYQELSLSMDGLPITACVEQSLIPNRLVMNLSSVQYSFSSMQEYLFKAKQMIQRLENQHVHCIVLPFIEDHLAPEMIQTLISGIETTVIFASAHNHGSERTIRAWILNRNEIMSHYDKIHLSHTETTHYLAGQQFQVTSISWGNVGVMIGEDGLFPESARMLTLKGADCIIWFHHFDRSLAETMARTRCAENRIFMVTNRSAIGKDAYAFMSDPNGSILASTVPGMDQSAFAAMPHALSRCKEVVPKSDVIFDRRPQTYTTLT